MRQAAGFMLAPTIYCSFFCPLSIQISEKPCQWKTDILHPTSPVSLRYWATFSANWRLILSVFRGALLFYSPTAQSLVQLQKFSPLPQIWSPQRVQICMLAGSETQWPCSKSEAAMAVSP
jgi:hypothetical protein